MADTPPRNMSLIPYAPAESREIVLRHGSSVVVYDQRSRQLSLRDASHAVDLADCPYCHRPLREEMIPGHDEEDHGETGFVNPEYFRMLRQSTPSSTAPSRPSSPHKQIAQTLPGSSSPLRSPDRGELSGGAPAASHSPQGISSSAFSQNYFKTFFVEEKELGRGGKGVVLLVRHVLDGVSLGHFACKRVPVGDDHEWLEKVLIEVQLLQNLSHQNLVSYRHVWLEDYRLTTFGPSVPCAFILQQYCNAGDLHHYILDSVKTSWTPQELKERIRRKSKGQLEASNLNGPRRMPFDEIFSFFKDITSGLNHLHANGYIHRDLKPSNCLLHRVGSQIKVLVSDFGEVQLVNVARRSTGATGTISYCAPEVLKREFPGGALGNFTTKSDIFSLGMIVYFMCFGRLPYKNADSIHEEKEDLDELRAEIAQWAGFDDQAKLRTDLPDRLYKFLKRLLSLYPADRPSTEDILYGISRGNLDENGGFPDLDGPRVSSADTPVTSPSRHARRPSALGPPKLGPSYAKPGPSKLRQSSVEPSRSPSPPKSFANADNDALLDSNVFLRSRKTDGLPLRNSSKHTSTDRLMLPPPPTALSRMHQVAKFLSIPAVTAVIKLFLFLAKAYSIESPCSPHATNPWVAYPLLSVAALDFAFIGFGPAIPLGPSVPMVLLCAHIIVLAVASRWDFLCLAPDVPDVPLLADPH